MSSSAILFLVKLVWTFPKIVIQPKNQCLAVLFQRYEALCPEYELLLSTLERRPDGHCQEPRETASHHALRVRIGNDGGGGRDGCPVYELCFSERRPGLYSRVGEVANSAVFLLPITTCENSSFLGGNLDIPVGTFKVYFLF